jgi:hypothetical protein
VRCGTSKTRANNLGGGMTRDDLFLFAGFIVVLALILMFV